MFQFSPEEIEDARILILGRKYEPQIKVDGNWYVYSRLEKCWVQSTNYTLRFRQEKRARMFVESYLTTFKNPMADMKEVEK